MLRSILALIFSLSLISCGDNWVENYERVASTELKFNIDPVYRAEIFSALSEFASEYGLEIVTKDRDNFEEFGFLVLMYDKTVSIACTNLPDTETMSILFFKALHEEVRPDDDMIRRMADDLAAKITSINVGVNASDD